MYKFQVFVPATHKEELKSAIFAAGGGKLGAYDSCCFETRGTGQFRPLSSANPFIGEVNKIEFVDEVKIEMVVLKEYLKDVIEAMKKTHPYEEPAYQYWIVNQ
ncbi:Conserved_hypothetical protein [Hexamita inflata]|uniref:NGG1p interacting factor NIF3 n=1 Tax=Hexamita inflata TaxID=28002 RepID=A0AA86QUZ6_9EUKA|nr:Conserved hypothetical protein [Hexamita inflata]